MEMQKHQLFEHTKTLTISHVAGDGVPNKVTHSATHRRKPGTAKERSKLLCYSDLFYIISQLHTNPTQGVLNPPSLQRPHQTGDVHDPTTPQHKGETSAKTENPLLAESMKDLEETNK